VRVSAIIANRSVRRQEINAARRDLIPGSHEACRVYLRVRLEGQVTAALFALFAAKRGIWPCAATRACVAARNANARIRRIGGKSKRSKVLERSDAFTR
jgi:hypothetical protein